MGTENEESCSQRDSAERKGYVRAHRSFNRIWCWTANSGHHQQHFIVSQKLKTAAESRLKITLLSLLRHLIIIMSETDY